MPLFDPTPGETPIDDVSGLKIRRITTRAELSEAEARNIAKATLKYLAARPSKRSARFDYAWCLKLHQEMFGKVWDWAGAIRTRDGYSLGIPWYLIPEQFGALLQDLAVWPGLGMEPIEQSARLHHRAVYIHPFPNGNGRWARMLGNIWLKQQRAPIVAWPERMIEGTSEIRGRYIAAIRAADELDCAPLIALHREFQES